MTKIPKGAYTVIAGKRHRLTRPKKSYRKQLEKSLDEAIKLFVKNRDHWKCCTPNARFKCSGAISWGHLFSGCGKSLRWDTRFIFAQCQSHNNQHEHRPDIMTDWFREKFGEKLYREGKRLLWTTKRFTLEELEQLLHKFRNYGD